MIDERTALVCCTTISYRTGHRQDVAEIARLAHAHGALVLADSYQAVGAIDLDVRALGVDFVTGGTVKYLLASAGLGFLYVRRELFPELMPTQTGWFADEDIFQMDISDYSPAADARRFDAGHAACAEHLRRRRGDGVSSRRSVSRRSRRTSAGSTPASSTGSSSLAPPW